MTPELEAEHDYEAVLHALTQAEGLDAILGLAEAVHKAAIRRWIIARYP